MAVRKTIQAGNPVIRAKAKAVKVLLDKSVAKVVTDLTDTMRDQNLVGIAAPQIGKSVRIFVAEVRKNNSRKVPPVPLQVFINPKITSYSKNQVFDWEGCGSVAFGQIFAKVKRPERITVKATDQLGEPFELETGGLLARIIQHEADHLDGVLFTDKADLSTIASIDEYVKLVKKKPKK